MARQRTLFVDTSGNVATRAPRARRDWAMPGALWRRRIAVLLAAITVPAMAATGSVTTLPGPAVESTAATLSEVVQEMLLTTTSERQGRVIDKDGGDASMEKKKQEGYF